MEKNKGALCILFANKEKTAQDIKSDEKIVIFD